MDTSKLFNTLITQPGNQFASFQKSMIRTYLQFSQFAGKFSGTTNWENCTERWFAKFVWSDNLNKNKLFEKGPRDLIWILAKVTRVTGVTDYHLQEAGSSG